MLAGVQPIELRHVDVGHDNVRLQFQRCIHQRASIGDSSDHMANGFQEFPERFEQDDVVVRQQDLGPIR
jgi:hypothetical protein